MLWSTSKYFISFSSTQYTDRPFWQPARKLKIGLIKSWLWRGFFFIFVARVRLHSSFAVCSYLLKMKIEKCTVELLRSRCWFILKSYRCQNNKNTSNATNASDKFLLNWILHTLRWCSPHSAQVVWSLVTSIFFQLFFRIENPACIQYVYRIRVDGTTIANRAKLEYRERCETSHSLCFSCAPLDRLTRNTDKYMWIKFRWNRIEKRSVEITNRRNGTENKKKRKKKTNEKKDFVESTLLNRSFHSSLLDVLMTIRFEHTSCLLRRSSPEVLCRQNELQYKGRLVKRHVIDRKKPFW